MKTNFLDIFQNNQKFSNWAVKILIGVMFGVAAVSIVQFGQRIASPTFSWNGWYLPVLVFLISQVAFLTKDKLESLDFTEKSIYYVTEWIIFAVLLKIIIYLVNSPDQFWLDLPLWQQNPANFFTGEYLPVLVILFLSWVLSSSAAGDLTELQSELTDFKWELGKLENNRQAARQRIAHKVLIVGGFMVFIAMASRLELRQIFGETPASQASLAYVLIFFMLALVFLSQTQFALLRGRWFWNQTPITPNMGRNWIKYSLLFFALIGLISFILPTRYTYGLLETIQVAFSFLLQVVITLIGFLTIPCGFIFSLFNLKSSNDIATAPTPSPLLPPPIQAGGVNPWWELIKSILFWAVFMGVIGYSFLYFIRHNTFILATFRKMPGFGSLVRGIKSFWAWLVGVNQQLTSAISSGFTRIFQTLPKSIGREIPQFMSFRNLSPRQQVIFYYLRLIDRSKKSGIIRKPSQTPNQFASDLQKAVPDIEQDLETFTNKFVEARYSRHPVNTEQTSTVQRLWRKIVRSLSRSKPKN
ncbi:MAG TPA: DUF4129 domain-containing protein [Leptolinea sp.]